MIAVQVGILICISVIAIVFGMKHFDKNETSNDASEQASDDITTSWVDFSMEDCIELVDYSNMSVTIELPEMVTDADLIEYVNCVLQNYPQYNLSDKTVVEKNDCVFIDLQGILENETAACVEESDLVVNVGSGVMLPEIDETLPGKTVGDSFEVIYEYPESFADEEYRGKKITFMITVKGIYTEQFYTYDKLTDEYCKDVLQCRSTDDFLSQIKTEMYGIISDQESELINTAIMEKLVAESKFEIPETLYKQKYDQQRQQFINQYCGGDETIYEEKLEEYTGMSEKEYKDEVYDELIYAVQLELAALKIADDEKIISEEEAFNSYVAEQMENTSVTEQDSYFELFDTSYESGKEYLEKNYLIETVTQYIRDIVNVERSSDASVTRFVFGESSSD